jgi:MFS family permease
MEKALKEPLPRVLYLILVLMFFTVFGFAIVMPYVAIYLNTDRKVAMNQIALIFLIIAVVRMVGNLLGGESADRFGRKISIVIPLIARIIIFSLVGWLTLIEAPIFWIVTSIILAMVTGSFIQPSLRSIITDIVPPDRRVEAFGLNRIAVNLGWAGGTGIGTIFIVFGFSYLFFVSAGICLILLGILFFIPETRPEEAVINIKRFKFRELVTVLRDTRFAMFCAVTLISFLALGQMTVTFAMFGTTHIGVEESSIMFLFFINGMMVVFLQWPISMGIKKMNPYVPLAIGTVLFGIGYFITGFAMGWWGMLIAIVVVTIGEMLASPTVPTVVSSLAPRDKIGRYMGMSGLSETTGRSLGSVVGPLILGMFLNSNKKNIPASTEAITAWAIIGGFGLLACIGYIALGLSGAKKVEPLPPPEIIPAMPEASEVKAFAVPACGCDNCKSENL